MLGSIFEFLLQWYVWMPIVGVLLYLARRNNQKATHIQSTDPVLLVLEIPRTNDKQELAAEQLFASLHGILRDKIELRQSGESKNTLVLKWHRLTRDDTFLCVDAATFTQLCRRANLRAISTVQIHEAEEDYTRRHITHSVVNTTE